MLKWKEYWPKNWSLCKVDLSLISCLIIIILYRRGGGIHFFFVQCMKCMKYFKDFFNKSEQHREFQISFLVGSWRYTHQCQMMNHSFRRSFDSSAWRWGCLVRLQRAPCRPWARSFTSHRDLWLACPIGQQSGGKPETSPKMSTSKG